MKEIKEMPFCISHWKTQKKTNITIIQSKFCADTVGNIDTNMSSTRKRTFQCAICSFTGKSEYILQAHIDKVHLKKEQQACVTCSKTYSSMPNLQRHINDVHKKLKPFTCETCAKSFSTKNYLKVHIDMIHLEMKHMCKLCGQKLATLKTLKQHIEAVHEKKKPHKCTICDRKSLSCWDGKDDKSSQCSLLLGPFRDWRVCRANQKQVVRACLEPFQNFVLETSHLIY